jgi:Transglutaminase-like superfamily
MRNLRQRLKRRGTIAASILVLWGVGLAALARRELFRSTEERLAEAALRVAPGTAYYAVQQGGAHIGFAFSTIDTAASGIQLNDFFVADFPVGGGRHRASARSKVSLSRALALREFSVQVESDAGPLAVAGRPERDTLVVTIRAGDAPADTQRVAAKGTVLLPTVVPLAVALGEEPKVGRRVTVQMFDPVTMAARDVALAIRAESLFVVSDSAVFDDRAGEWRVAHEDTVRAWQLTADTAGGISAWVDGQGRLVELSQPGGLVLRRAAYELAHSNWEATSRPRGGAVSADDDVLETTAIAASAKLRGAPVERLRVRLRGVPLDGFALAGERQRLAGDTLSVEREGARAMRAYYALPGDVAHRAHFRSELAPEPLLEVTNPEIAALAVRVAGGARDPRTVAERLNRWVYDSLDTHITVGVPDALQVLHARRGDCNEHTQLYVALARAAGIPARAATGLAYVDGKFYYHAWPEVYLGTWVAVDPTLGQFPADAAHLRFVIGGLDRQAALLRLIGRLKIDVIERR